VSRKGIAGVLEALGFTELDMGNEDAGRFGVMRARVKQQQDALTRYRENVAKTAPTCVDEVFKHLNTNPCDHAAHRIVPAHENDMTAVVNLLTHVVDLHVSATRRVVTSSYHAGLMIERGEMPGNEMNGEALFGVLNVVLIELAEAIAKRERSRTKCSVIEMLANVEISARKVISDQVETMMNGGNPPERPSREHCH